MDIAAIRDRLQTLLASVSTLRAADTVPSTVTPPNGGGVAIIVPAGNFADVVTMDDATDVNLNLIVVVSKSSDRLAQDLLDAYAVSVVAAVDVGTTADWDYCVPGTPTDYGDYTFGSGDGAQTYLGFTLPVTVGVS